MKNLLNYFILFLALLLPSLAQSKPANRIISLDLCSDWMLVKYAQPSQILALSSYIKQYPVDWVDLSQPTHNGSLEQLLALKPDLVLVGEYNATLLRQRLIELGIRVEILPLPRSLADIGSYEQKFLSLVGLPQHLASKAIASNTTLPYNKRSRLLLIGANGIGTGKATFEDELIERAGWRNYLTDDGYIRLDLEQLISDPPDALLWTAPQSTALANLFAKHPALNHVIAKDQWLKTDHWRWECPGPWTWTLIEQLKQ